MRTINELEQEIDRIYEIRENATFMIKSLRDKIEYLRELFSAEYYEEKKAYELGYKEKNKLESNAVRFLDGESCIANFEIEEISEVENK
jgi:hypothetical protein